MHVCFVGQEIHPPWIRGDPQLFKAMIDALKSTDLDISLITTYSDDRGGSDDFEAFTAGLRNLVVTRSAGNPNYSPRLYQLNTLFLIGAARNLMKKEKIDIFHLGSLNALLFAPLFKQRKSNPSRSRLVRHIYMLENDSRISLALHRACYAHFVDGLATTSQSILELLCQMHLDREKLFVIPPIVEEHFFRPTRKPNKTLTSNLLYLGSVTPNRFPLSILRGLQRLEDCGWSLTLTIVGRYPSEAEWMRSIKQYASQLGLQSKVTTYVKALDESEKLALYNSADVVLLPFGRSVGAMLPPLVLLEAMSCGTIVLATKTHDMDQVIEHGYNGLLVDNYNPEQFADTINFWLAPDNAERLRANARKTVMNNFTRAQVLDKILQMYDSVLTRC
jgi:glycosyltransferase involved in cell wall biosynthesis